MTTTKTKQVSVTCISATLEILGITARYTLSRSDAEYIIDVFYGEESASRSLGGEVTRAEEIFFRILRGRVTPCTLGYIFDEFDD